MPSPLELFLERGVMSDYLPKKQEDQSRFFPALQARKEKGREIFPVAEYINPETGDLVVASVNKEIVTGGWLPPDIIQFKYLAQGQHPLLIAPEGRDAHPEVIKALQSLLTNLEVATLWEQLFIQTSSRSAQLFVIDQRNDRYRVVDVVVDVGDDYSGVLKLQPMGRRGRGGKQMQIDIQNAYSYMLPVVVYKPY